jgi:ketosteroid isomerase-like protein
VTAGDHLGPEGILGAIGPVFEATGGDVKLEQQFCVGVDGWAAEWEHAVLGRHGRTLESDNAFVYRFTGGRIAEMWMFLGADPEAAAAFFG